VIVICAMQSKNQSADFYSLCRNPFAFHKLELPLSHREDIGLPSEPRELDPKPTFHSRQRVRFKNKRHPVTARIPGRFKGAIRIPLHSLSLFFSNLVLPRIPRKSLKSLALLFSISTPLALAGPLPTQSTYG
jgi:hypothetical protein